jgi:hypothetical protein
MADHNAVSAQGLKGLAGIHQRLALFDARCCGIDDGGMSSQQLGGKLKRHSRASGRLIKQQGNALAAKQGPGRARVHFPRQVENGSNIGCAEVFQIKQRARRWHYEIE